MSDMESDAEIDFSGSGGSDDGLFEPGALDRANAAIARLKQAYVSEWAPASIDEMYEALAAAMRDRPGRRDQLQRMYRLAHDMKGQGGTFGFELLTDIGETMCRLTGDRDDFSDGEFVLLRAHIDAARRIVLDGLDGEGGEAGRELMASLQALSRVHFH